MTLKRGTSDNIFKRIYEFAKARKALITGLSCFVVFITTYLLILPAITLDQDEASRQGGIDVPEQTEVVSFSDKDYEVSADLDNAGLPKGTEIVAEEISKSDDSYDGLYEDALKAVQKDSKDKVLDFAFAKFYDISLVSDGESVDPENPIAVTISYDKALNASNADKVRIVHFAMDEKTGEIKPEVLGQKQVDAMVKGGKLTGATFEAESFSVYAVVYTVDFSWEVDGKKYEYSLPGGGCVSIGALIEALGITKSEDETKQFVSEIANAEFSNPELIWVGRAEEKTTVSALKEDNELNCQYSKELTDEQIEEINGQTVESGDWALISLQPFDTEENLTVTMKTGEVFTIKVTDTASANPEYTLISRSDMNVDNREEGIIIKLFDYSGTVNNGTNIDAVWGSNTNSNSLRQGSGVNNGRTLVFSGSGLGGQEWYNNFTGTKDDGMDFYSGYRQSGIVKNELVNGYPELIESITRYGNDDGNLDYLFKAGEQSGVTEYSANGQGLQGLLRKDSDGYYYYSSEDNYARFDGNDYIDLYTDTYFKDKGQNAAANNGFGSIGFFPYTDYDPNHKEEKGPNTPNDLYYNHQLGMSMETHFTYPPNGKLDDGQGDPMTFEFSGDDDVWVYVDGRLALDLGGVHQPIKGIIDFANQEVRIYEYESYSATSPKNETITTIPFSDIFGEGGFDDTAYSTHKLDFFFLERGGCDSNCALRFNLQTLATAEKEFSKVDGDDAGLPGAEFTVYTDEACTQALTVENEPLAATSDSNGNVSLSGIPVRRDSNGTPLVYYMKETKAPFGYKKSNTVYQLVYNTVSKAYDIQTMDGDLMTAIVNEPVEPIELSVEKKWQDAAGNEITPENGDSATFELHRLRSYTIPKEVVTGSEETLRIRHVANDSNWATSGEQTYNYLRGRTVTINYDYHGTTSNNKRQYRYSTNNGSSWNYSANPLPNTGSFDVQIPASGQYIIEFYDVNHAVTWTIDDGASEGGTFTDQPDPDFSCEPITLSGSQTTGTFDSGLYAGTANAGKFPVQETKDDINYTYKYYITEKEKVPANSDTIYVDSKGKTIADPSTLATDEDGMQTVINRKRLDIPVEKYWHFGSDVDPNDCFWTATFQLLSSLIDPDTGDATSFEPIAGKQLTVSSADSGQGQFSGLPIYCMQDGKEYRIQYSVKEIAYEVTRISNGEILLRWQDPDPDYNPDPFPQIGDKYSLHYIQDAGENGDTIGDYSIILNNTPENRKETKTIEIALQKTWPDGVDLSDAHADFVLKRYVSEEYRNFPSDASEWVDITLDTGNGSAQTLHVPKDWNMSIICHVKANTNAEHIEFSDGTDTFVYSFDNSSGSSDARYVMQFVADRTKTVTLAEGNQGGSQYAVGGINGFRLSDINSPNDIEEPDVDHSFELPVTLSNENDWHTVIHRLTAIEEDTQYDVENPLEITRYIYRYFLEEKDSTEPQGYFVTLKDSSSNNTMLGDVDHMIDFNASVTAVNKLNPGSLKITKRVKVDGEDPTEASTSLVDGTYYFTVAGVEGTATAEEETRTIPVTISGGEANTVEVPNLTPGDYIVTELPTDNGTYLMGNNGVTATVKSGETGETVSAGAKVEMTNNIDTTQLTVNKVWTDDGQEGVDHSNDEVGYKLYRIPYVVGENDVITEYDPEEVASATGYAKVLNAHTIPKWTNEITNLPKTGTYTLEGGVKIPVQYEYYVSEGNFEGYKPHVIGGQSGNTYSFTFENEPHSSFDLPPTEVSVEKQWKKTDNTDDSDAHDNDSITFNLVQNKYEAKIYPVRINLFDGDGTRSELSRTIYMPRDRILYFWPDCQSNGNSHRVNVTGTNRNGSWLPKTSVYISNANGGKEVTFRLQHPNDKWGTEISGSTWTMTAYDSSHSSSHTENDYIVPDEDGLRAWIKANAINEENYRDNPHEPYEYTMKLNEGKNGTEIIRHSASAIGQGEGSGTTKWQGKVTDLPYYEKYDNETFYTYTYEVTEIKINTEDVTPTSAGPGQGETSGYTVTWAQDPDSGVWTITNTKKPGVDIVVKKVDEDKASDAQDRFLEGAKFSLYKIKTVGGETVDELVTDLTIKEFGTENVISIDSEGKFEIPLSGVSILSVPDGDYKLVEKEAPAGYNIPNADTTFTVYNGEVTESSLEPVQGTQEVTFEIPNPPGAALPSAGGPGTTWLYLIGSLLLLGCGVTLVARRRTRC